MKIKSARLENFMLFDDFDMAWSPNINVICGSNSTGKTVLIKFMYALLKAWRDTDTEKETIIQKPIDNGNTVYTGSWSDKIFCIEKTQDILIIQIIL